MLYVDKNVLICLLNYTIQAPLLARRGGPPLAVVERWFEYQNKKTTTPPLQAAVPLACPGKELR